MCDWLGYVRVVLPDDITSMKKNSNKRIVFSARLGWYSDLIKKLEENWVVDIFKVHYWACIRNNGQFH